MHNDLIFKLPDVASTKELARRIYPHFRKGDFVALYGPLGVGKTEFARAFIGAMGVQGEIPSPTFTLVQHYDGKDFPVFHFDLYRLKNHNELEELGWDDAIATGLVLVEWPEKAGAYLPRNRLEMHFSSDDKEGRFIKLMPFGEWEERVRTLFNE